TPIEHPQCPTRFLILDCPSDETLPEYLPVLEDVNVTHIIRITENQMYNPQPLMDQGIAVHDTFFFEDGTVPSEATVDAFLSLLDSLAPQTTVAVHCISGIGRAPVLVTLALVDAGVDPMDAIEYVRARRRGALNNKQVAWI
ncbi:protein-tyrosine phosphatase-like protein, partial [Cladochytrium replicatum]